MLMHLEKMPVASWKLHSQSSLVVQSEYELSAKEILFKSLNKVDNTVQLSFGCTVISLGLI